MKVALVLGKQQGSVLKPRLQSIKDNLDIDCFESIPIYIDISIKRSTVYDRVLIVSTLVGENHFIDLYNYWDSYARDTQIVVLGRDGVDEALLGEFLSIFKTPTVATMLVKTTTVQLVAEAILRPTIEINKAYGLKGVEKVEVLEDSYDEPKVEVEETSSTEKREKRSLLGALFGTKKSKEPNKEVAFNTNEEDKKAEEQSDESSVSLDNQSSNEDENLSVVSSEDFNESEVDNLTPVDDTDDYLKEDDSHDEFSSLSQDNIEDSDSQDFSSISDIEVESETSEKSIEDSEDNSAYLDFGDESDYDDDIADEPVISSIQNDSLLIEDTDEEKLSDLNIESTSSEEVKSSNDDFKRPLYKDEPIYRDIRSVRNDFEPEPIAIDEDLSDTIEDSYEQVQTKVTPTEEEVHDDLSGVDVSSDENAYRAGSENVKVVTKVVEREVIRNIGTSSSVLQNIYNGRNNKVIIVTGDRCTGITTTALALAKSFAKNTNVLYVDFDAETHGLLSYIDYSQFGNYEPIHHQGVKLCKNSRAFDNCVIRFGDNFDILSTDYSCDCTNDELTVAQEVIAERFRDYGVVIVDCPLNKFPLLTDLTPIANFVFCIEGTKRGFMNMLCRLESGFLSTKVRRHLSSRCTLFLTKKNSRTDTKKLLNHIMSIYEPDDINWLDLPLIEFNGQVDDSLLSRVVEG